MKLMLRLKEAQERYSLSAKTLRYMVDEGHIAGGRTPGGHRRVNMESADQFFNETNIEAKIIFESIMEKAKKKEIHGLS